VNERIVEKGTGTVESLLNERSDVKGDEEYPVT